MNNLLITNNKEQRTKNRRKKTEDGQSLVEILIALAIFSLTTTAAFQLFFGGQSLSIDNRNVALATDYGWEGMEALRNIRSRNWEELTDGAHSLVFQNNEWMFASSSTSESQDIFTRTVTIGTGISEDIKIATTTVTWQGDQGRLQSVVLVEQLTNWEDLAYSSCKIEQLSGNWALPVSLGSGDIGAGNSGTDVVVRLPYVYVSGTASTASKHDIFVFDVSDPNAPILKKSLDIGAGGINSIFVKGNYLYAASVNDNKELIIFNISDPVNMSEVGSYNLSGSADGIGVIAFSNTVALGRSVSATKELAFINVNNPASPTFISQTATGGDVNDFAVRDTRLFLVSEESDEDVWVFDISNSLAPVLLSTYDITGITEDLSIFFNEKKGATLLVGNEQNEIVSIGATTTAQMYVRDRVLFGGDVNDITCVGGDLAFLATADSNKEFLVVNLADPENLVEYASLNYPALATGIDFADNKVFMSVRSNDALRIITSSP